MPWLLAGDFHDKIGGAPLCILKGFKRWVDNHGMIDLDFTGPKYTWTNKKTFERIDRAVCNLGRRSLYPKLMLGIDLEVWFHVFCFFEAFLV